MQARCIFKGSVGFPGAALRRWEGRRRQEAQGGWRPGRDGPAVLGGDWGERGGTDWVAEAAGLDYDWALGDGVMADPTFWELHFSALGTKEQGR